MRTTFVSILLLVVPTLAAAHDFGCGGKPVPADVKSSCCGKADAHQVSADQIEEVKGGIRVTIGSQSNVWPIEQVIPSNDGCYWVWYNRSRYIGCSPEGGTCTDRGPDKDKWPITWYCLMMPFPT